jgi:membrane-associated phospholipid phosphatase
MLALAAALLSLAVSVGLSNRFVAPRPYVFRQQVYRLEDQALVTQPRQSIRMSRDGGSRQRLARLEQLDIPPNDFGTFPSDHASLFVPLAMGVWLVSRRVGTLALIWTALFILYPKLHLGLHSIRDLAAGAALGLGALGIVMGLVEPIRPLRRILWRLCLASARWQGAASGLVFVAMYEICSKFEHVEALLASAKRFLP